MKHYIAEKLITSDGTIPITLTDPDTGESLNVGIVAWTKNTNTPYIHFHSRKNEALGLTALAKKHVPGKVFELDGGDALPAATQSPDGFLMPCNYRVSCKVKGKWTTLGYVYRNCPEFTGHASPQLLELASVPPRQTKTTSLMFLFPEPNLQSGYHVGS